MAYILLYHLKDKSHYYGKLFNMISSEVEVMDGYINKYIEQESPV